MVLHLLKNNFVRRLIITVNVPIVSQRQSTVVSSQAIPIANVYSQGDNQQQSAATANVYIPLSSVPRRTSPSELFYLNIYLIIENFLSYLNNISGYYF